MPLEEMPRKKIVRTGCLTCKIRKIKCDEGKPACSRCVSTGRKCDGYQPITGLAHGSAPPSQQAGTDKFSLIIRSLPSSLPGDTKERRSLYFFIHCTAPGLTGNFHSGFWEHLILQACVSEPALRNIAVAIGSIHEMLSTKRQNVQQIDRYAVSLYAFQQYSRSVHQLNRLSATIKQQPEILLFSCILFVCFDCLRGQYESAGSHLAAGLEILYQWKTRNLNSSTDPSHVSRDTLIRVFTGLGIQAGFFVTNPAVTGSFWGYLRRISCEYPVNEDFIGLEDARRKLNALIVDICYVLSDTAASRQAVRKAQTSFTDVDVNGINRQTQEDLEFLNGCFSNLQSWSTTLERFLSKTDVTSLGSKDLRAATLLKIYHYTIMMVAKTVQPSDSDILAVEGRNCEFETILKLTKALLSAEAAGRESPNYTFVSDLGVIIPLYVIVVHCKDLSLRLEALDILKRGQRREGLWEAEQVAKICERVLTMECGENYLNERLVAIRAVSAPVGAVDTEYSVELDFGIAGTDLGDLVLRTENLNLSSG